MNRLPNPVIRLVFVLVLPVIQAKSSPDRSVHCCLVGSWRSESIVSAENEGKGGAGIILTIDADGRETIDYNGMQPLRGNDGGTHLWSGAASGHIVVDLANSTNGNISVIRVESSNLTHKFTNLRGDIYPPDTVDQLGPAASIASYTCDETTLTLRAGSAWNVTFKRQTAQLEAPCDQDAGTALGMRDHDKP